ncbi:phosphotransferase [Pseudomonadales bacterium]|nr:phosphotransferase [Pseudomonadales bacterium]
MTAREKSNVQSIVEMLGKNYSSHIGTIVDVHKVMGLEINSSNLRVEGTIGSLVIKILDDQDSANFDTCTLIYAHIKSLGLPGPQILGGNRGELLGRPFIVMDYIPGYYFSGSKLHLSLVGSAIRDFHQGFSACKALTFPELPALQSNSNHILTEFISTNEEWDLKFGSDLAFILRKNIDLLIDTEARCSASLSTLLSADRANLHIDLHPHNIIVGASKATIIDIDSLKNVAWPSALGFCFYKLARQVMAVHGVEETDYSELRIFFETIVSGFGISEKRINLCFIGGLTEILRRILIILEGNSGAQVSPWNQVLEIQIQAISEMHFLYERVFGYSANQIDEGVIY